MFSLHNVSAFIQIISSFVAYLITVSPVGYFKAWIASVCGDDTAQDEGFMTLDPLVHFDLIGLIALLFLGIGWGRNVPVNVHAFHEPYRKIKIASALFAPTVMHALLSCIAGIVWYIVFASSARLESDPFMLVLARILFAFIILNSFLAVMTFFINAINIATLLVSERYVSFAQHAYYVILLGPLAIILIFELFNIHLLSYMHAMVWSTAFLVGKVVAGFFGIH
jgi:hypothetical protein